jgi:Xaa-Pro aminopeptidase
VVGDRAVIAVEPMLEFAAEELHIRIEDTVLITDDGAEVLTVGVPKDVDELLALVGNSLAQGDASP